MTTSFPTLEFDTYADRLLNYLRILHYSDIRIHCYQKHLIRLKSFLLENRYACFDSRSLHDYIEDISCNGGYENLTKCQKDKIRVANVLAEYYLTGTISYRIKRKKYCLTDSVGEEILKYLEDGKARKLSLDTLNAHMLYLSRFNKYLHDQKIVEIVQVDSQVLYRYVNSLVMYTDSTRHCTLCAVRVFLRYIRRMGITEIDLSPYIPKDNYKKHAKLPTTYTEMEIETLIKAVDRANPKGKRDYAIILLAARLGLRASDICQMTLKDIQWERNTISLIQKKTGSIIELPLLVEVGNAIIDYLKYARPVSNSKYLFLHVNPRYERLQEPTIHSIVSKCLLEAGIKNVTKKKHGPHALRHSLASLLLEKKTPLPIISEILGHSNTESTKTYLSIDITALRQCALETPPLTSGFYGGDI